MDNNQDNINQEVNNEPKKKGHGPLYWIIVIIGITFIMYMSILIGERLNKAINPDTNNSKEEVNSNVDSNITNNDSENKETKITDKVKIDYLKKYINILEYLSLDTSSVKVSDSAGIYYFMNHQIYALDKLEKKDITMDNATTAIVGASETKRSYGANELLESSTLKHLGEDADTFEHVSVNDFIEDYKTLFGFENISTKNINVDCETYVYDKKANAFVMVANGCGTAAPVAIQKTYVYDVTEDNNNVYVYLAYGVTGQTEKGQYVAYTDYAMNNKYTGDVTKDFTINESNYKDFSKYKYTFTKNSNGTYTFSEFSLLK